MCGRIAQFGTFREIVELINIWNGPVQAEASPPRYNFAPATRAQVLNVVGDALLARQIRLAPPSIGAPPNARQSGHA